MRRGRLLLAAVTGCLALSLLLGVTAIYLLQRDLPEIHSLADYRPPQVTRIYSDDGELVGELFKERRTVVAYDAIPKHVVYAFLAAEDAGFFEHEGLDYLGILRAALKNLRPGAHRQGASTITQQTVKTLVVGAERSYTRKLREALLSRQLEQMLSKEDILTLYLNQIWFGSGAYGVEEASLTYFGKSVRELDLGEAALLASVPKNPTKYTPRGDPTAAKERQTYVLGQMLTNGWAEQADVDAALNRPVPPPRARAPYLGRAPHYIEHVARLLTEAYGEELATTAGLTVYTGMSARAQIAAQDSLRTGLEDLARQHGYPGTKLRLEVDRLPRALAVLHEAFHKRVEARAVFAESKLRPDQMLWNLEAESPEALATDEALRETVRVVPLTDGARVRGVVEKVDSVDDVVHVDLGGQRGRIRFRTMQWARRFSPQSATPSPKDPSEVLRPGDLVTVEVGAVPVRLAHDTSPHTLELTLVPEPRSEGALVAIDPHTRLVRALVGGYEQSRGGLLRATQARRQPGSAFKPIVYAAGLAEGAITPASICPDTPIVYREPSTGTSWKPENYEDGKYDGNITYRVALTRSKNTCSVKLIDKLGPDKVINMAQALGIDSALPRNLTLALGSGDVTPLELTNAYSTIASGGLVAEPIFIRKVVDRAGKVLLEATTVPTEVLRPAVAYVLTQMMRSVVEEGTATRALVLDRPLAGKTGTSNESRNVWFGGFSAELAAVVWVGFDDNAPLGRATGGSTALPIWIRFMGRALDGVPRRDFTAPPDVVFAKVDADTGEPSADIGSIEESFVAGTEPTAENRPLKNIFEVDDEPMRGP